MEGAVCVTSMLLSARSVVRRPAPIIMSIQPTPIGVKYRPVFLTAMPVTIAIRLMLYDNPIMSTPASVEDFSLQASKKIAYQSDSSRMVVSKQRISGCGLSRTTQRCQYYGHQEILDVTASIRQVHTQHNGDLEKYDEFIQERLSRVSQKRTIGGLQK